MKSFDRQNFKTGTKSDVRNLESEIKNWLQKNNMDGNTPFVDNFWGEDSSLNQTVTLKELISSLYTAVLQNSMSEEIWCKKISQN